MLSCNVFQLAPLDKTYLFFSLTAITTRAVPLQINRVPQHSNLKHVPCSTFPCIAYMRNIWLQMILHRVIFAYAFKPSDVHCCDASSSCQRSFSFRSNSSSQCCTVQKIQRRLCTGCFHDDCWYSQNLDSLPDNNK